MWRDRLHHGIPLEALATVPPPLLFRGRADSGSTVEIRAAREDEAEVLLDGVAIDTLGGEIDFDVYETDGRVYHEVFEATPEALGALRDWVADPSGPLPAEHLAELHADGLIDRHFGLTARGRRYLRLAAAG